MTNRQYRIIPTFFVSGAPGWTYKVCDFGKYPATWEKGDKICAFKTDVEKVIDKIEADLIAKERHLDNPSEIYIPKVPSGG